MLSRVIASQGDYFTFSIRTSLNFHYNYCMKNHVTESFHWDNTYKTGLEDVDSQHHKLVNIINQFSGLLSKNSLLIEDIDKIYSELKEYTVYHFEEEEKLITDTKVDDRHYSHHVESHKNFVEDVSAFYSSLTAGDMNRARDFLKYLIHWLAYHILGEDQDLAHQIKAIQSGLSPKAAYDRWEKKRVTATAPLLDALNGLFEQVATRNKELKLLNESLEAKVAERTKALIKANEDLETLSYTDPLTGLYNRRFAMQQLSELWENSLQEDSPLVCMMIDTDYFKEINDVHGHDVGDKVLIKLAQTFKDALRNDDYICRLGGDEFLIICPHTDLDGGLHIGEITRKAVSEFRITLDSKEIGGSVSIGVAARSPGMTHIEDLIKAADNGVYAAKNGGKNCVRTGSL